MAVNVNKLAEQSLPTPNNEGSLPNVVIQLHEQLASNPALEDPKADIRRRLGKLSIPANPVCIPESSSCAQSPCESIFPPFPAPMYDLVRAPPRTRNIIVFGETGVGKSSVINMIAGKHVTRTSNDAVGCTFRHQCYQVPLDGLSVNLWDTAGLDEGTEGTVPAGQAENNLKAFLRQITRWNGIDLLLYCVRGTRVRQALLRNYNIFYGAICRKKVPVALVVTGLENYEGDMETWWAEHEKDLIKHGMRFDAHACVTTIRSDHPAIQDRLKQSREVLRNLMRAKFDAAAWRADEGLLMTASLTDARALLRAAEKRVAPLITICDATEHSNRPHLLPTMPGSQATRTSDREYRCLYVDARGVLLRDSKLWTETVQRPDLLIFYSDAESDPNRTWTAFERFHVSYGGDMCPVIVVFMGLDSHEAAAEMWRLMSSSHGGAMVANPTYYPGPDGPREIVERADAALAALVEEKCLIKLEEEKLSRFQRFCRRRFFFTGRM
ncbi:hypothetical protein L210DRAFT_3447054 [Boletus edulis BED1]|uniref:G domain-containing protein n=1 Tax=Boletus edulis BED1 TaxID=1328754 RepID=A0AAD4BWW8_BOLED|nr:hypothetical protein L210DRAFT_3447054 [Boletus edulis BED1]